MAAGRMQCDSVAAATATGSNAPAGSWQLAQPGPHHAQNDDSRSVCFASTPCTDLNHWRSASTSDTSAMGTCSSNRWLFVSICCHVLGLRGVWARARAA